MTYADKVLKAEELKALSRETISELLKARQQYIAAISDGVINMTTTEAARSLFYGGDSITGQDVHLPFYINVWKAMTYLEMNGLSESHRG